MIQKFTHPRFELDLNGKNITIVEENHWFSDQFFTKYTFPIQFDIDDELDVALNMITHINSDTSPKIFEGYLQEFGEESEAVFVIERIQGRKCEGKIRFGFEEFPNYDKKLSELNLQKFTLQQNINDYALGIIGKTFPEVNFNFPQIIVDTIETNDLQWQFFEGIMNNYVGGAFLINEYDAVNDTQINRNIMQPLPYLLHVIQQGFEDAGLTLAGDILEDPEFKKAVFVGISDYYSSVSPNSNELVLTTDQYVSLETIDGSTYSWVGRVEVGHYESTVLLAEPGVYKIAGNIYLRQFGFESFAEVELDGVEIFRGVNYSPKYYEKVYTLDKTIEISVAQGSANLVFTSTQLPYEQIGELQNPEGLISDLTITKISGFDAQGNRTPSLVSPSEINLTKCVPDKTFGDLLKTIKNWKNYDIDIDLTDKIVYMNKIQKTIDSSETISLKDFEVKYPIREFNQDKTFLLQFQEVPSEEYSYDKTFVDANGARTNSFVKQPDTNEITINALPLPLKQEGVIRTAHCFIDSKSQMFFALYDGLTGALNTTQDPFKLLIPAVYQNDWKEWINFRIIAEGIEWTFRTDPEMAGTIKKSSKISAYGKNLFVRRVSKKNLSRNVWEITLECEGSN